MVVLIRMGIRWERSTTDWPTPSALPMHSWLSDPMERHGWGRGWRQLPHFRSNELVSISPDAMADTVLAPIARIDARMRMEAHGEATSSDARIEMETVWRIGSNTHTTCRRATVNDSDGDGFRKNYDSGEDFEQSGRANRRRTSTGCASQAGTSTLLVQVPLMRTVTSGFAR